MNACRYTHTLVHANTKGKYTQVKIPKKRNEKKEATAVK